MSRTAGKVLKWTHDFLFSHSCITLQSVHYRFKIVLFITLCISTGGKGVEINIGNAMNAEIGFNAGGIGAGNNVNINNINKCKDEAVYLSQGHSLEVQSFVFVGAVFLTV